MTMNTHTKKNTDALLLILVFNEFFFENPGSDADVSNQQQFYSVPNMQFIHIKLSLNRKH